MAVDVLVDETWVPTNVMRDEPDAPLSNRFDVLGVKLGTSYTIKLTVHDGATGAVVATASRTASTPHPTGV